MTSWQAADRGLLKFKSHVAGKNADVTVHVDRIEWALESRIGLARKGSEIIPIKSVSSITTRKDGLRTIVSVICTGNTVDFRVNHTEADRVKDTLLALILGNHPAQTGQEAQPPPPQAAHLPPPPPPNHARLPPPPPESSIPDGTHPAPVEPSVAAKDDHAELVAKIKDLGELRDAGVLDEAEFAAAKAKLLN